MHQTETETETETETVIGAAAGILETIHGEDSSVFHDCVDEEPEPACM